jgi:hypothetical protein
MDHRTLRTCFGDRIESLSICILMISTSIVLRVIACVLLVLTAAEASAQTADTLGRIWLPDTSGIRMADLRTDHHAFQLRGGDTSSARHP